MPEYIHEENVTFGQDLIFPNVQSCAAVIVVTNGDQRFGGYHITRMSTAGGLTAALQHITGGLQGAVSDVMIIGNAWRLNASGAGANGKLANLLKAGLNYAGKVRVHQSTADHLNAGIAVRISRAAGGGQHPELRINFPGTWVMGPHVANGPDLRRARPAGIGPTQFATYASANLNVVNPTALLSLETV